MSEIEERDLFEQERKIFEAGAQRTDKRTGSFSFLTWPFFIAPLIASESFSDAATLSSGAPEDEDGKAAQASVALQSANDDSPATDISKTSAEDESAKEAAASSDIRAARLDPTGLLIQSEHDDAPRHTIPPSEAAIPPAGGGGGGGGDGGGGDDADSRVHEAHGSIEDSSLNLVSADSHVGSNQLPAGSTLEFVQSDLLGDSFNPWLIGSAPALLITSANDVASTIAPIEAAVQPVLAAATDTVNTLTSDVAGTIAPVEAAVQPVLGTATDTVSTLTSDVAGTIAPVEAAVQPVLAAATDTVSTLTGDVAGTIAPVEAAVQPVLGTATDAVSTLTGDVAGTIAPVEAGVQPVLGTATDTVSTLTNDVAGTIPPTLLTDPAVGTVLSSDVPVIGDAADPAPIGHLTGEVQSPIPDFLAGITGDANGNQPSDNVHVGDPAGNLGPATTSAVVDSIPALAPAPGSDADPSSQGGADGSHVAALHIGSSGLVAAPITPLLPNLADSSQTAAPETPAIFTDHPLASAAPALHDAEPSLAAIISAASQPITSAPTSTGSNGSHPTDSSASALHVTDTALSTGSSATADAAQPGNQAGSALGNIPSDAAVSGTALDTTAPALAAAGHPLSNAAMPDVSTDHAPGTADSLLALASAGAPIEDSGFSAAAAPNAAAGVSTAAASGHPTAIAGDVIALNDAPPHAANALFTGTQYTDYGVTLSSGIAVPQQHATSSVDATSDPHTLAPVVADVQQHAPPPPDIVDTTHPIDHLGLRDAIL